MRVRGITARVRQPQASKIGKMAVVEEWPRSGTPKAFRPQAPMTNPVGQFDNFAVFC